MSPIRISTKDNVALTIPDRSAEYRALVDAERCAEIEALAITNKIREQVHIGKDGRISGRIPRRTSVWKREPGQRCCCCAKPDTNGSLNVRHDDADDSAGRLDTIRAPAISPPHVADAMPRLGASGRPRRQKVLHEIRTIAAGASSSVRALLRPRHDCCLCRGRN